MAFLGIIKLGDNLTFYAQTSTPATGAETDADAVPSYRIYEEETAAPILTGNMALLDDANTVGWYSEQIAVSIANGFEAGKSYAIRKRALMATVPGSEFDTFQVTTRDMDDLAQPGDAMNATEWGGVAVGGMPNSTTPPTVGQIADAVYDEALVPHDAVVGSGAEAWADAAACGLGADGPVRTYTVTNSITGLPESAVYVRVTTDVAGLNTIRAGYTDVFGNFYPRLIAGTYYFWCTKQGFSEVQADMEVFV